MQFDAVLLSPRRTESIARGYWYDRTINQELDACLAECPDKLALTAVRVEAGEVRRFTYREMATLADRIAVGLSRLGVGRNDVVAMQPPNWWHFSLLYLACSRIGAVLNPLMPIFRERELSFMLKHAEAKVLVVPKRFGISITRRWRAVSSQNCRPSSALSSSRAVARMISMLC